MLRSRSPDEFQTEMYATVVSVVARGCLRVDWFATDENINQCIFIRVESLRSTSVMFIHNHHKTSFALPWKVCRSWNLEGNRVGLWQTLGRSFEVSMPNSLRPQFSHGAGGASSTGKRLLRCVVCGVSLIGPTGLGEKRIRPRGLQEALTPRLVLPRGYETAVDS